MAFTDYGYDLLRANLVSKISHVGIYNGATKVATVAVDGSNVTVADDAAANKITVTAVLKGDGTTNAAITTGVTVDGMKLFDSAAGTGIIDDETYASAFTFNNVEDQLTLKITINAPAL